MSPSKEVLVPEIVPPLRPVNLIVKRCPTDLTQAKQRICVFKLGALGDLTMATPLLTSLRDHFPHAHVTWIVEHGNRAAIEAHPMIDALILWNGGYMTRARKKPGRIPENLSDILRFFRLMRSRRFDIFIDLQAEEWVFMPAAAHAGISIGVFDPKIPPRNISHWLKSRYDFTYMQGDLPAHRTDQYCLPLLPLGAEAPVNKQTSFGFTADDAAQVEIFLGRAGIVAQEKIVTIAPLTTWPSRCWPLERFVPLIDALTRAGCQVVLIGSPEESAAICKIADRSRKRPILATGDLTFRQIAALISRSDLLISSDTGPMHVAGAVKTPFVALFGPTPVEGRFPFRSYGIPLMHPVPCGPCDLERCPLDKGDEHMQCMRLISVEEVLEAAYSLLGH